MPKHNFDSRVNIEQLEELGANKLAHVVAGIRVYVFNMAENNDKLTKEQQTAYRDILQKSFQIESEEL